MKKAIISFIEGQKQKMVEMSDNIFDRPESGGEEFFASELLTGYLRKQGSRSNVGSPDCLPLFALSMKPEGAVLPSDCFANTTRFLALDTVAHTICRALQLLVRRRHSKDS